MLYIYMLYICYITYILSYYYYTHITITRHIRSDVYHTRAARLAHAREFLHDRHARPPRVLDTLLYKAADSHMLGTAILNKYT